MSPKSIKESDRKTVPKALRGFPAELVTLDAADKTRVHKNDPPHVLRPLLRAKAQALGGYTTPLTRCRAVVGALFDQLREDPFRFDVLDQELVDLWRARTILAWAARPWIDTALYHLWFTENNGKSVCLREGPAPERPRRPKYLKALNLEVQVLDWPQRLRDIVKSIGILPGKALEEIRGKITHQQIAKVVREARQ